MHAEYGPWGQLRRLHTCRLPPHVPKEGRLVLRSTPPRIPVWISSRISEDPDVEIASVMPKMGTIEVRAFRCYETVEAQGLA